MQAKTQISGITLSKDSNNGIYICYIENFSNQLKEEIKNMLSNIWHGSVDSSENQDIFDYISTLADFLDRYNSQSINTKKGIIGELLTHLLIPKYIPYFKAVTIMKNKEERSIKKGFDLVYHDSSSSTIWYCEVKSGGDQSSLDVNKKNCERLTTAQKGISDMLASKRVTIWQSVLNDVNLTIFSSSKRLNVKELLKEDYPIFNNKNSKNIILSSVLYKKLDNKICPVKLKNHKDTKLVASNFLELIVFSIQKSTYTEIEYFLKMELNL